MVVQSFFMEIGTQSNSAHRSAIFCAFSSSPFSRSVSSQQSMNARERYGLPLVTYSAMLESPVELPNESTGC